MTTKRASLPLVPPQIINQLNDLEEAVERIYRKVDYVERTIRYHENENWCEHED